MPAQRFSLRLPRPSAYILASAVLLTCLGLGIAVGRATADPPITVPAEMQRSDLAQPFNDFFQAYHIVTTQSYYAPLSNRKALIYAAINGMLSGGTGDAHTIFLSPEDNSAAQSAMNGSFAGIGAYIDATARGNSLLPLAGSPAARAGLLAGDLIVRINGQDVTALNEGQVANLLRGAAGTRVTIGVQRAGRHGILTVIVVRALITVPDVSSRMLGSIAYLRLLQFGTTSGIDVEKALYRLMRGHPRGLVLDLRDNPGGYVDDAIEIASQFMSVGKVVLWEQGGDRRLGAPRRTIAGGLALSLPLIVLVNDGTASAAEITAGALQDNHRATVVGITTYGKGSEQEEISLVDGSSARVTTHMWLTPNKHVVQYQGITPDIVVDSPVADGSPRDTQLARALQILAGLKSK